MPHLRRLCEAPGCGQIAVSRSKYCQGHKAKSVARARERKREADKRRPNASQRGYGRDWKRVRGAYIKAHPWCEKDGCNDPTEEVHHIVPLAKGGERLKWSNLKGLCGTHHKQHEAEQQRGEGGRFKARWR